MRELSSSFSKMLAVSVLSKYCGLSRHEAEALINSNLLEGCPLLSLFTLSLHPLVVISSAPSLPLLLAELVKSYNTVILLQEDLGKFSSLHLEGFIRQVRTRLRILVYDLQSDLASLGLPIVVYEGKKGYPLYYFFNCSYGCWHHMEESKEEIVVETGWDPSIRLEQRIPRRITQQVIKERLSLVYSVLESS